MVIQVRHCLVFALAMLLSVRDMTDFLSIRTIQDTLVTHSSQHGSDRTEGVPCTASYTFIFGDMSWRGVTFQHMAQALLSFSFVLCVEFLQWSLVVLQVTTKSFGCD